MITLFTLLRRSPSPPPSSVFMSDSSPTPLSPFTPLCSLSRAEQLVNVPSTPGVILAHTDRPSAGPRVCVWLWHRRRVWGCWAQRRRPIQSVFGTGGVLGSPHLFSLHIHSTIVASPLSAALVNSLLITMGKDPKRIRDQFIPVIHFLGLC